MKEYKFSFSVILKDDTDVDDFLEDWTGADFRDWLELETVNDYPIHTKKSVRKSKCV